jgi:hypothetical protein
MNICTKRSCVTLFWSQWKKSQALHIGETVSKRVQRESPRKLGDGKVKYKGKQRERPAGRWRLACGQKWRSSSICQRASATLDTCIIWVQSSGYGTYRLPSSIRISVLPRSAAVVGFQESHPPAAPACLPSSWVLFSRCGAIHFGHTGKFHDRLSWASTSSPTAPYIDFLYSPLYSPQI